MADREIDTAVVTTKSLWLVSIWKGLDRQYSEA